MTMAKRSVQTIYTVIGLILFAGFLVFTGLAFYTFIDWRFLLGAAIFGAIAIVVASAINWWSTE